MEAQVFGEDSFFTKTEILQHIAGIAQFLSK